MRQLWAPPRRRQADALINFLEEEMLQEAMRRSMDEEGQRSEQASHQSKIDAILAGLKRVKFGIPSSNADEAPHINETECPLCLEEYHPGEEVLLVSCGHAFHEGCLGPWLMKSLNCPMCMREIGAEEVLPATPS